MPHDSIQQVLSPELISMATQRFAASPGVPEKMVWWLYHAHSSERWIQFEWAFQLQCCLGEERYLVACEVNRVDVVCFKRHGKETWPIEKQKPTFGIELKYYGSWWYDETFYHFVPDVRKLETSSMPSVAVLFALFVEPSQPKGPHAWIQKNVHGMMARKIGREDFETSLADAAGRSFVKPASTLINCNGYFKTCELQPYIFYSTDMQ